MRDDPKYLAWVEREISRLRVLIDRYDRKIDWLDFGAMVQELKLCRAAQRR